MNLQVDIQRASGEPAPDEEDIRSWINAALSGRRSADTEISIRLVDTEEMTTLNQGFRNKPGPTNVLSFPSDLPQELELPLLGDIVICAPVVREEASAQQKSLQAHWAHMIIHGTLHLLGYDHIEEEEALVMESLETEILTSLNYPCPYKGEQSKEHADA